MGRRRWQARSAGAQRPLSLLAAACRAGSQRSGAGWLDWGTPRAAAQSPPTTLAEWNSGEAHGAVRASSGHRCLQSLGGGLGSRGQTLHSTREDSQGQRALRLRACFPGAPHQPGEALKSPVWAEEYPEIPGPVLGVFMSSTTRWKGLAWPSRLPSHRRGRLTSRQKPTNIHDSLVSQTGE